METLIYDYPDGKSLRMAGSGHRANRPKRNSVHVYNPIDCPDCEEELLCMLGGLVIRKLRKITLDYLADGPHTRGFEAWLHADVSVDGSPITLAVRVSTDEGLATWIDRHRSPDSASGDAVAATLRRVEQEEGCWDHDCCVCMEELSCKDHDHDHDDEGDVVMRMMPCGHIFHGSCTLEWLLTSPTCPLCRSSVQSQSLFRRINNKFTSFFTTCCGFMAWLVNVYDSTVASASLFSCV